VKDNSVSTAPFSGEVKVNEQTQRRIRAYRRAEWVSDLAWFGVLAIVELIILTDRSLPIHRLVFYLAGSLRAQFVLETFQNWYPWRITVGYLAIGGSVSLLLFPLRFLKGFVLRRRYRLSRESLPAWLMRWLTGTATALFSRLVSVQLVYALLIVQPQTWWLWTALLISAFWIVTSYLGPIVYYPLRYKCTTIRDSALVQTLHELSAPGGCKIVHFKRTARRTWRKPARKLLRPNGYAIGWGKTRTIILTDGLLRRFPPAEIRSVLAHEIGHHIRRDHEKKLALSSCLLLFEGFLFNFYYHWGIALLRQSVGRLLLPALPPLFAPLALAVLTAYGIYLLRQLYSRHIEYQADEIALRLTGDVAAFRNAEIRMMNLHRQSLKDSLFRTLEHTHPSPFKRLAHADEFACRNVQLADAGLLAMNKD
jgi:STE24 endopeptidase